MQYKPKVSVIIPIYNAEAYLSICIDSILAQTFTDWELLLINDGSKDDSGNICDEYVLKDSRIHVFHIKNTGANNARMLGVQYAKGEYIMFVDSDDIIMSEGISKLLLETSKNEASIIVGHMRYQHKMVTNFQYVMDLLSGECSSNMWSKLYKTNIIKDSFCDISKEYPMGEDLLQNIQIALWGAKNFEVLYCDTIFYKYNSNVDNITNTFVCTQEYEKKFHEHMYKILDNLCFKRSINEQIKRNIWINWQKSGINGFKKVIINSENFNYKDSYFVSLNSAMKSYKKYLKIDELIVLYVKNRMICKHSLNFYYNMIHIYICVRNFFNFKRLCMFV